MKVVRTTASGIAAAVQAIRAGGLVAYPTDTVYGLGVDPFNETAVQRLFTVKGRDEHAPFPLIIDDPASVYAVAARFSAKAKAYATAFWPGPLSLLLPKAKAVPDLLTGGSQIVCVRCPDSDIARSLCRAVGGALTSTSANRSGEPPALAIDEVKLEGIAVGIDGGRFVSSPPSTIVDPETGSIVRQGAIPEEVLRAQFPA